MVKGVKLQALRQQYESLHMGEDENVAGYKSKVHNLIHMMKSYGETMSDRMIIEKLMRTLTSHFDHVTLAI